MAMAASIEPSSVHSLVGVRYISAYTSGAFLALALSNRVIFDWIWWSEYAITSLSLVVFGVSLCMEISMRQQITRTLGITGSNTNIIRSSLISGVVGAFLIFVIRQCVQNALHPSSALVDGQCLLLMISAILISFLLVVWPAWYGKKEARQRHKGAFGNGNVPTEAAKRK